jgi:hypothetical protein
MILGQSPITEKERTARRAYVEESLATLQLEEQSPCPEALSISERYVNGELTVMELGAEIRALNARKFRPLSLPQD